MLDIFGTGVIILPRRAAFFAGRDGWIAVALSSVLACFCAFLICRLIRIFPGKSFFDYTGELLTKPLAYLLSLGLIIKVLIALTCELWLFGEIVKAILLRNTPLAVIMLCLLALSAYAAYRGIETRARIAQIIIWLIFIPLIFVLVLVSCDVDFTNILPLGRSNPYKILEGGFYCLSAFSGLEFILLLSPYLSTRGKSAGRSVSAIALMGIILCTITLITISRFGAENIKNEQWPVLEMMDAIDLPGTFIERQEAIIMSIWMLSGFAGINAGLYFGMVVSRDILKKGKAGYHIFAFALISFLAAIFVKDINLIYKIIDFNFLYMGTTYMIILPILLNLAAAVRGYKYAK